MKIIYSPLFLHFYKVFLMSSPADMMTTCRLLVLYINTFKSLKNTKSTSMLRSKDKAVEIWMWVDGYDISDTCAV